jgi:hypothetical protein
MSRILLIAVAALFVTRAQSDLNKQIRDVNRGRGGAS